MYLWTEAEPLPFFGLFEIPSPFTKEWHDLHEAAEAVHKYVANPLLLVLLGLHFLGALKRIFFDQTPTLTQ
jgi:cytochrome b561